MFFDHYCTNDNKEEVQYIKIIQKNVQNKIKIEEFYLSVYLISRATKFILTIQILKSCDRDIIYTSF